MKKRAGRAYLRAAAAAGGGSSSSSAALAKAACGVRTRRRAAGRAHGAQKGASLTSPPLTSAPLTPPPPAAEAAPATLAAATLAAATLAAATLCGLGGEGGGAADQRPSCAHSRQSLAALTGSSRGWSARTASCLHSGAPPPCSARVTRARLAATSFSAGSCAWLGSELGVGVGVGVGVAVGVGVGVELVGGQLRLPGALLRLLA